MLPLFPLSLVVFPHEHINLHIFEPRYRELIQDCVSGDTSFGITPYLDKRLQEYGTQVRVFEVVKRYDDGRMDITAEAIKRYRLRRFVNPIEGKLYAGGEVAFVESDPDDATLSERILLHDQIQELYAVLNVDNSFDVEESYFSYQVAHKIGLSQEQEYELLLLDSEKERLAFLRAHLDRAIPIVRQTERTKELIRLNGHFKNFDPLNF
ncbi:MAG: LON peptidase substrate-binding domain-containing protein [Bernardetiaceae bacterium]